VDFSFVSTSLCSESLWSESRVTVTIISESILLPQMVTSWSQLTKSVNGNLCKELSRLWGSSRGMKSVSISSEKKNSSVLNPACSWESWERMMYKWINLIQVHWKFRSHNWICRISDWRATEYILLLSVMEFCQDHLQTPCNRMCHTTGCHITEVPAYFAWVPCHYWFKVHCTSYSCFWWTDNLYDVWNSHYSKY
jgi:hypothetical protein